jgi:hypothetical protein
MVPEGVTSERQRARYVVRVYKADIVFSSISRKNMFCFYTDHVNPYVKISFAGLKVRAFLS